MYRTPIEYFRFQKDFSSSLPTQFLHNKPIDAIYWVNIYNHLRTKHFLFNHER